MISERDRMGQRCLQLADCAEQSMAGPDSLETVPG